MPEENPDFAEQLLGKNKWNDAPSQEEVAQVERSQRVLPMTMQKALGLWIEDAKRKEDGVTTGFPTVDSVLGTGVRKEEVLLVAARTGVGKSWILQYLAEEQLKSREDLHLLFVSLEMSEVHVAERVASHIFRRTTESIRREAGNGNVTVEEAEQKAEWINRFALNPNLLRLEDLPFAVQAACDMFGKDVEVLLVDYVGLLRTEADKRRYDMVSEVATKLKDLAKQLHITIILAAQLSRGGGGAGDREPYLDALRDSGVSEEAADRILMMWAEPPSNEDPRNLMWVKVEKNRFGAKTTPVQIEMDHLMVPKEIDPYGLVGVVSEPPPDNIPF